MKKLIVSALALGTLAACSSAPATDADLDLPKTPTHDIEAFQLEGPFESYEAYATSKGAVDTRDESMVDQKLSSAALGEIVSDGALLKIGDEVGRHVLVGKPGALYALPVVDSWTDNPPPFFPYASAQLDDQGVPPGYFQLRLTSGRSTKVDDGTRYESNGFSYLCREHAGGLACAKFLLEYVDYVETEGGTTPNAPNGVLTDADGAENKVEVYHLQTGEQIAPAGVYTIKLP